MTGASRLGPEKQSNSKVLARLGTTQSNLHLGFVHLSSDDEHAGQLNSDTLCCTGVGIAAIQPAQAASIMTQHRRSVFPPRRALAGRAQHASIWIPAASAASMPQGAAHLQVDESADMLLLASQASDYHATAFRAPSLPLSLILHALAYRAVHQRSVEHNFSRECESCTRRESSHSIC